MREILSIIVAALLAAPVLAADSRQAESAIKAVVAKIDACINARDAKCLGALFTDDATFSGPLEGGRIYAGKSAIVGAFESMIKDAPQDGPKQVRSVEKIRFLAEDRALVDASIKLVGLKEEAGRQDWHSTMLVKSVGGNWMLEDIRFYVVVTGGPPTPGPTAPSNAGPASTPLQSPPAGSDTPGPEDKPAEPAPPDVG